MSEARQIVPKSEQLKTIGGLLEQMKANMAMVIPKHLRPEKLVRLAMGACQSNPKLLECTQKSLLGCIMEAAKLGFEVNSPLRQCSLVPFRIKGQMTCTLIPEYRGLMDLARQSGQVSWINAAVVYQGEEHEYAEGLEPVLRHVPKNDVDRSESNIVAAYAVARLKDGSTQFIWMWKSEVDARRSRSRASDSGPWVTDYAQMAKKTCIKELCDKRLPRSTELARAIDLDNDVEIGQAQSFDLDIQAEDVTPEEPAQTEPIKTDPPLLNKVKLIAEKINGEEFDGICAACGIEPGTMLETLDNKALLKLLGALEKK